MTKPELDPEHELALRHLEDGRSLVVTELTFGRARLHIGPTGGAFFDNEW